MKRPTLLLAFLVGTCGLTTSRRASAEKEIGLGVSYDPRVAVGGLRDVVPSAAVAGVQAKWEYYAIAERLALGVGFQYHYFQAGGDVATYQVDSGAVTGAFTRYAYFFTLLPTARVFPLGRASSAVRPYGELGLGATSAAGRVLASDLSRRSQTGGLVVQPSVGVLWAITSRGGGPDESLEGLPPPRRSRETVFGITTSLAWTFTTADVFTATNVSYVGAQLGLYAKL